MILNNKVIQFQMVYSLLIKNSYPLFTKNEFFTTCHVCKLIRKKTWQFLKQKVGFFFIIFISSLLYSTKWQKTSNFIFFVAFVRTLLLLSNISTQPYISLSFIIDITNYSFFYLKALLARITLTKLSKKYSLTIKVLLALTVFDRICFWRGELNFNGTFWKIFHFTMICRSLFLPNKWKNDFIFWDLARFRLEPYSDLIFCFQILSFLHWKVGRFYGAHLHILPAHLLYEREPNSRKYKRL